MQEGGTPEMGLGKLAETEKRLMWGVETLGRTGESETPVNWKMQNVGETLDTDSVDDCRD